MHQFEPPRQHEVCGAMSGRGRREPPAIKVGWSPQARRSSRCLRPWLPRQHRNVHDGGPSFALKESVYSARATASEVDRPSGRWWSKPTQCTNPQKRTARHGSSSYCLEVHEPRGGRPTLESSQSNIPSSCGTSSCRTPYPAYACRQTPLSGTLSMPVSPQKRTYAAVPTLYLRILGGVRGAFVRRSPGWLKAPSGLPVRRSWASVLGDPGPIGESRTRATARNDLCDDPTNVARAGFSLLPRQPDLVGRSDRQRQDQRLTLWASRGTSTCTSGLPQPVTGFHPGPVLYPT